MATRQALLGLGSGLVSGTAAVLIVDVVDKPGFRVYEDPFQSLRHLSAVGPLAMGAVLVVAAVNAQAEEWLFRGVILRRLIDAGMALPWAVAFSSLSFGAAHLSSGLPGGPLGLLLAGGFGAVVGTAYARQSDARSFVLCSHFAADVIIIGHALLWRT
jgi:membrane protease YdiL (CAAX protease family)